MHRFLLLGLLSLAAMAPAFAQQPDSPAAPIPTPPAPAPLVTPLNDLNFNTLSNNVGIAQTTALAKGLQGRVLWMDAGANVGNLNTTEKIGAIVGKVKAAGMNMIVLDVKPIVGETVYPSKFAPRLTSWKGQSVSPDFDVLRQMLTAAHAQGLPVYANMSTFGEGHKYVKRGLAYTHPDWQTVLYEVDRGVTNGTAYAPIGVVDNLPPRENTLAAVTNGALLRANRPGYTVAVLNFDARVLSVVDGSTLAATPIAVPPRGAALLGFGRGSRWLKRNAIPNQILTYTTRPKYVPIVDAPEQLITMFVDPNHPEVRQHELDMVRELVTNYDVDGVVFDDRLRYAAVNADFSPRSRAAFEKYVGKSLVWPDDVLRLSPYPGQDPLPGPYYQQWLDWRAGNIKSWVTEAAGIVRSVRPGTELAVYVGSWYGDYEKVASNWAAPDFAAPYHWMTPTYQATGYAGLLDWLTTGCYYEIATLEEARTANNSLGATVEAAGQLSNRVVNDSAWTYAGLYALSYQNHPDAFARALRAATASTQGVMVFDMSQIIQYDWWHILGDAFAATPATPPNRVPGLLADVRRRHAEDKARGVPQPDIPPYLGVADTGF